MSSAKDNLLPRLSYGDFVSLRTVPLPGKGVLTVVGQLRRTTAEGVVLRGLVVGGETAVPWEDIESLAATEYKTPIDLDGPIQRLVTAIRAASVTRYRRR